MKLPSWLYASIAAIILLSCYSLQKRYQVESKNKATCIVAEYEVLEDLASSSQMDIGTALKQLKQNGKKKKYQFYNRGFLFLNFFINFFI